MSPSAEIAANPRPSPDHPRDKWLWWPVLFALGMWFLLAFLDGLPGLLSFILIPISVLSLLFATVVVLALTCRLTTRRRLRKAISLALALLIPFLLSAEINRAADCLHLALTIKYGFGALNAENAQNGALIDCISPPAMEEKASAIFDWSVGLAGGPSTFLIRLAADEPALPLSHTDHPASLETTFADECAGGSRHVFGRYYVCDGY